MHVLDDVLYLEATSVVDEVLYIGGSVSDDTLYLLSDHFMYKQRMLDYYPQAIQKILEFQSIIDSESPEIMEVHSAGEDVLSEAYLVTMSETRIKQWENALGIKPIEGSSVEDRRDTIIARIRGQGKLNTTSINAIVSTFTGGKANSWIKDGTLYVEITPPPNNKQYQFKNVEQELAKKVPTHLKIKVNRNYYTWKEISDTYTTWGDVKSHFNKWEDVLLFVPFETEVHDN